MVHYDFGISLFFKEAKKIPLLYTKLHPRGTAFVILDKFAKHFLNEKKNLTQQVVPLTQMGIFVE